MTRTMPVAVAGDAPVGGAKRVSKPRRRSWWRTIALTLGAIAFLFPFYYMIVGSLQRRSDTSLVGALPLPGNFSFN
ncbi:MAG TPA: hypothetical protein VGP91_01920, partial [Actinoplanes sp.]|nr:hypothetical protein [Actinoplanes sp.]